MENTCMIVADVCYHQAVYRFIWFLRFSAVAEETAEETKDICIYTHIYYDFGWSFSFLLNSALEGSKLESCGNGILTDVDAQRTLRLRSRHSPVLRLFWTKTYSSFLILNSLLLNMTTIKLSTFRNNSGSNVTGQTGILNAIVTNKQCIVGILPQNLEIIFNGLSS